MARRKKTNNPTEDLTVPTEDLTAATESAVTVTSRLSADALGAVAAAGKEAEEVVAAAKERQDAADARAAEAKAIAEASPWHVVKDQSDQDTTMEACNIATGHQMPKAVLMRCRMKGKIVGNIILMQGLVVKQIKGIWQLK